MRSRQIVALWLLCALLPVACGGGGGTTATQGPGTEVGRITYAGLGASDAVGSGAWPLTEGYVYEIERHLQGVAEAVELHNFGINGAHVSEIVASELPGAIQADPDVVTVWTGGNDIVGGDDPDDFAAGLATLLAELKAKTNALIFVADLPDFTEAPLFRLFPDPDMTPARLAAFNERIVQTVADHDCILVRISDREVTNDHYAADGFHPSNLGHQQLADAFFEAIEPRL